MGVRRATRTVSVLTVLVGVVAGMTGCGGDSVDRVNRTGPSGPTNVGDIVREASEFAGIVIPENATVLDAGAENGIDTNYRIALSTNPQGLEQLLADSRFSTPLTTAYSITETTIAGPPLETSPSVLQAGDIFRNAKGKSVNRNITVDERDPSTRFVHLQLYDT